MGVAGPASELDLRRNMVQGKVYGNAFIFRVQTRGNESSLESKVGTDGEVYTVKC